MITTELKLFPAHAGMNRDQKLLDLQSNTVPRTRGDEPYEATIKAEYDGCSPHTRG